MRRPPLLRRPRPSAASAALRREPSAASTRSPVSLPNRSTPLLGTTSFRAAETLKAFELLACCTSGRLAAFTSVCLRLPRLVKASSRPSQSHGSDLPLGPRFGLPDPAPTTDFCLPHVESNVCQGWPCRTHLVYGYRALQQVGRAFDARGLRALPSASSGGQVFAKKSTLGRR
ncbi:hypothetical protein BS50DRAFT_17745 [Corynespora cassiicola Philippines]|uniref:Uncharacterized protein n=1 Tax=Corynespora cassiicola Philippines TaxID=1448308 RepID=A0A2T2P9Z4_CORCC|nr:hypothetical protein BS50DRAFT_17745 [Corynespora cassiicola Philippines]